MANRIVIDLRAVQQAIADTRLDGIGFATLGKVYELAENTGIQDGNRNDKLFGEAAFSMAQQ